MNSPTTQHPDWLTSGDFAQAPEPWQLFAAWFDEAAKKEPSDPTAMAVATVDAGGMPNVRTVLMKGFDATGIVFYTNYESRKGVELLAHSKAALLFHWKSLKRQVRFRGMVTEVSAADADAYFATRPRLAQIGAWASAQSRPLESRFAFEQAVAVQTAKFGVGTIPRPPHWSGFHVAPDTIEFWEDRPFRLHERVEFTRAANDAWTKTRLYP